jgi:hypothetical protein
MFSSIALPFSFVPSLFPARGERALRRPRSVRARLLGLLAPRTIAVVSGFCLLDVGLLVGVLGGLLGALSAQP